MVDFELNHEGVRELLRSEEMKSVLSDIGNTALSSLGEGYELTEREGKNRANVQIAAETFEARHDNSKNNSILKALPRI